MRRDNDSGDLVPLGEKYVLAATDKAIKIGDAADDEGGIWLPRSVCGEESADADRDDVVEVEVKKWFAEKEGLG